MHSDKPEAHHFQDWVARVVLSAIPRDGEYVMVEEKIATGEISENEQPNRLEGLIVRIGVEKGPRSEGPKDINIAAEIRSGWSPDWRRYAQVRTRTLNGTLRSLFQSWYPGLANDNQGGAPQAAAA